MATKLELDPEFTGPLMPYEGPPATAVTVSESLYWPLSDEEL